ncbi:MAG: DctP family TRAP transporter solute-binding subunit, partial [Oscillospiraceae bacterium]|nr:DctP family TRAP transporter solute-binding subunit [Oscillospiraceae bacterium]
PAAAPAAPAADAPAAAPADSAPAAAAPEYVIRFATNSTAALDNPQNVGTFKFEELVEERSGGRIDVECHINAALGGARDIVEGVQLGTIEMGDVENGPMDSFVPAAAVWNLPYLFTSLEQVHKIQASDIGKNIQAGFEAIGIKHLSFNDGGFRYFTNSKHPITCADDFKGLKIRVMESPIYIGMVEALGGSAVPMAFAELYTGLQQGTVDGQENPLDLIYAQNYFEVQKYLSLSEHLYYPRQHIINLDFFNSLPEDLQEVIVSSSIDACAYQNEYFVEYTANMLDALKEKGMEVSEFDKEGAIQATKVIWPDYYEMIGSGDAAAGEEIVNRIAGGEFGF